MKKSNIVQGFDAHKGIIITQMDLVNYMFRLIDGLEAALENYHYRKYFDINNSLQNAKEHLDAQAWYLILKATKYPQLEIKYIQHQYIDKHKKMPKIIESEYKEALNARSFNEYFLKNQN